MTILPEPQVTYLEEHHPEVALSMHVLALQAADDDLEAHLSEAERYQLSL